MSAGLEVRDLHVGYYRDLHILRGVRLDAADGAVTAILGANGTGKSTLLKSVFGLLRPERGTIRFDGRDLIGVPAHRMVEMGVSYIPQDPGVFATMTVEENLVMGAWPFRRDGARIRRKLQENYERFPILREKRRQNAGELSGGQKRMVEVGRALMTDPKLLLVDEPSAGLAKLLTEEMYRMLAALRDEGIALLLVDQDIRQALGIADHVYVLDLGRNRFDAPASEITDVEKVFWT